MEQLRVMQARLEAMELGRHREPDLGDEKREMSKKKRQPLRVLR